MYKQKKHYVRPEDDISILDLEGVLASSPQKGGTEDAEFELWNFN